MLLLPLLQSRRQFLVHHEPQLPQLSRVRGPTRHGLSFLEVCVKGPTVLDVLLVF